MKLSYNVREAEDATGVSQDTIKRAIRSGDLATLDPHVEGRPVRGYLIARTELERWLDNRNRESA